MLVVHMCIMIKYKIENNMFVYMATLIILFFRICSKNIYSICKRRKYVDIKMSLNLQLLSLQLLICQIYALLGIIHW